MRLLNPPPGLSEATVEFAGGSYEMLAAGDPSTGSGQSHWYAVIGLATDLPAGDYVLEATAREATAMVSSALV